MGILGFALGVTLTIGAGIAISVVMVPLVNGFWNIVDWTFRCGRYSR